MRLAYIDETYDRGNQFWVVGLVIPASEAIGLEARLEEIVARASSAFGVEPTAELHGYVLDGGIEDWEPMAKLHQARADIYRKAIKAIVDTPDTYVVRGGVDLSKVNWSEEHNDPHEWALKFLVEKIDREFLGKSPVMAICDDVGQKDRYRDCFSRYKRNGTGGHQPCHLDSFIDALHYVPSHYSRLVQAADLVAYAFRRATFKKPQHEKAAALYAELWSTVTDGTYSRWRLWPPRG